MFFWYPGGSSLEIDSERIGRVVPNELNLVNSGNQDKPYVDKINGPVLIFALANMEDEFIPDKLKENQPKANKSMGNPRYHNSAYFDDPEKYQQIFFLLTSFGPKITDDFTAQAKEAYLKVEKEFASVETSETEPVRVISIDTIALDLDGTLAKTDQPLSLAAVSQVEKIVSQGKTVIILTEDIQSNVDNRVISHLALSTRKGIIVFSDGGTIGYSFGLDGTKFYFDSYNRESRFSPQLRQQVLELLKNCFVNQFEIDERQNRISPDYRIDLRNIKMDREEFIIKAENMLSEFNIRVKIYKAGKTSIKIVLRHKEDALRFCMGEFGFKEERTLIMGDSARSNQIDRGMLTAFPNAVSINLGKRATTIARDNPNIIQLQEGVNGCLRMLSYVIENGGISEKTILLYRGQTQGKVGENGRQGEHEGNRIVASVGAQVSNIYNLNRLLRLLNLLRQSAKQPQISDTATDAQIVEYCMEYLNSQGLLILDANGQIPQDEDGNFIFRIRDDAETFVNNPKLEQFLRILRTYITNPEDGVKAINFQIQGSFSPRLIGRWCIVGFNSDLTDPDTLTHEKIELRYRKLGFDWIEAHNWTVKVTGKGKTIDQEKQNQAQPKASQEANTQRADELGAMAGEDERTAGRRLDSAVGRKEVRRGMGGIDFRALPIVTQAVGNLGANINRVSIEKLSSVNLNSEWQEIERLVSAGITPSSERIKEYLQASCAKGEVDRDVDKVISCISEILREEEESCCSTETMLRDILVVLEASRSREDLNAVFLGKG